MKNCRLKLFDKDMDVPLASFFDNFVPTKASFLAFQWVSIKSKTKIEVLKGQEISKAIILETPLSKK